MYYEFQYMYRLEWTLVQPQANSHGVLAKVNSFIKCKHDC